MTDVGEPAEALVAEDVSHSYGDLEVLDGVGLSLEEGEVSALIGANGSGKTTFLRILAGLLQPDEGRISIRSEPEDGREVGYLPQRPSFRKGFTVAETLEFYTELLPGFQPSDDYVDDTLREVGVADAGDRGVRQLSGGMTRLLGVAQARVGDPPVTLLDEPTSGLDPEMTRRIFDNLRGIAEGGGAVALTTHDLEAVERYADEVLLLSDGEIAESGRPGELVDKYGVGSLSDVFDEVVAGDVELQQQDAEVPR